MSDKTIQVSQHLVEWTDEQVSRFWDFESHFPERYFTYFSARRVIRFFRTYLKKAQVILDYGAGTGHLVARLLEHEHSGHDIVAADYSSQSVAKLKQRFEQRKKFHGAFEIDTEFMNSWQQKFDLIFLIETVEHLNDDALENVLQNIRQLLVPGGILLLTTPYRENLSKSMACCPACAAVFHRWQHVRTWNEETLQAALSQQGFHVLKMSVQDFSTHPIIKFLKHVRNAVFQRPDTLDESLKLVAIATSA